MNARDNCSLYAAINMRFTCFIRIARQTLPCYDGWMSLSSESTVEERLLSAAVYQVIRDAGRARYYWYLRGLPPAVSYVRIRGFTDVQFGLQPYREVPRYQNRHRNTTITRGFLRHTSAVELPAWG